MTATVTVEIKADGTATVDDLPKGISFAGETVTLTWTNTRDKGSISITKTGSANKSLQGAVFGLYKDAAAAESRLTLSRPTKTARHCLQTWRPERIMLRKLLRPMGMH